MSKTMSKGISTFQEGILILCWNQGFLSVKDILQWWFKPAEWKSNSPEYNAAYASVSRTISRLWQRNLIQLWKPITGTGTMLTLTDQGKKLIEMISDNG